MNATELPQKKVIPIGIAIVVLGDRVLVGKRDGSTHLGGMDEFPGGKCAESESAAACAIRECAEETGLQVEITEQLHQEIFEYEDRSVDLSFFLCQLADEEEANSLNEPFRWVRLHTLEQLNFPDGNDRVLQRLRERF